MCVRVKHNLAGMAGGSMNDCEKSAGSIGLEDVYTGEGVKHVKGGAPG
jgi:hypothetical protein